VSCYLQTGLASFTIMAKILSEVGIELEPNLHFVEVRVLATHRAI
jgi:hypothetical protein